MISPEIESSYRRKSSFRDKFKIYSNILVFFINCIYVIFWLIKINKGIYFNVTNIDTNSYQTYMIYPAFDDKYTCLIKNPRPYGGDFYLNEKCYYDPNLNQFKPDIILIEPSDVKLNNFKFFGLIFLTFIILVMKFCFQTGIYGLENNMRENFNKYHDENYLNQRKEFYQSQGLSENDSNIKATNDLLLKKQKKCFGIKYKIQTKLFILFISLVGKIIIYASIWNYLSSIVDDSKHPGLFIINYDDDKNINLMLIFSGIIIAFFLAILCACSYGFGLLFTGEISFRLILFKELFSWDINWNFNTYTSLSFGIMITILLDSINDIITLFSMIFEKSDTYIETQFQNMV